MFLTSIGGSLVWGMHTPEFASAKMEGYAFRTQSKSTTSVRLTRASLTVASCVYRDPIIHGFRHDEFEFFGTPGQFYNLVSDGNTYQVSQCVTRVCGRGISCPQGYGFGF